MGWTFAGLRGRPLQLIDCQNLFCEVDKYARAAHPEVAGISGRTRIKQAYRRDTAPLTAWFPPKWGLNERRPAARIRSAFGPRQGPAVRRRAAGPDARRPQPGPGRAVRLLAAASV